MRNVTGRHKNNITGSAYGNRTFTFGNINTYCVHNNTPLNIFAMVNTSLPIAYSIYWGCYTNAKGFNLRKTNAANEELVG